MFRPYNRRAALSLLCLFVFSLSAIIAPDNAHAQSPTIHLAGQLTDATGQPLNSPVNIDVDFTTADGTVLLDQSFGSIPVEQGNLTVSISDLVDGQGHVQRAILDGATHISLTINGEKLEPPISIGHMPRSIDSIALGGMTRDELIAAARDAVLAEIGGSDSVEAIERIEALEHTMIERDELDQRLETITDRLDVIEAKLTGNTNSSPGDLSAIEDRISQLEDDLSAGLMTVREDFEAADAAFDLGLNAMYSTQQSHGMRLNSLDTSIGDIDSRLIPVEEVTDPLDNSAGQLTIQGVDVVIQKAAGQTEGGNLILGDPGTSQIAASHSLILGKNHDVSGEGHLVVGSNHTISSSQGSVVLGNSSSATANFASVTGGSFNEATGVSSSVSGGKHNTASGSGASVSGGRYNDATANGSSVSGGQNNQATAESASVVGGRYGTASGNSSTVTGGSSNQAQGHLAVILGGQNNVAAGDKSSVVSGLSNTAQGPYSTITTGQNNTATGQYAFVSGGHGNRSDGDYSGILTGKNSTVENPHSLVVSGESNRVSADFGVISSGHNNHVDLKQSVILTGQNNTIVELSTNPFVTTNRIGSVIVAGENHSITGDKSSILAGNDNTVGANNSAVVSGYHNQISGGNNTIIGGNNNNITGGTNSVIVGATSARIEAGNSLILHGYLNKITTYGSIILHGSSRTANTNNSVLD